MAGVVGLVAAAALLSGCRREEPTVVVYVAVDEHAARPVLARFTERTGIVVVPLFDGEINKTTGLVQRLRREQDRPRADCFWSNEEVQIGRLAQEGVLRDGRERLVPTFVRSRVLVYDSSRVRSDELPATWWELAEERFKDRLAMADPRFGSTATHLAGMAAWSSMRGEPDRFDSWCRGLSRNRARLLSSGNAGVVRAVASGEADFGLTDTDDVAAFNAESRGAKLSMVILRHGPAPGEGPWVMRGFAGVVREAPHAEAADRLVEYLGGAEAQSLLASAAPGFHPVAAAADAGFVDRLEVDPAACEAMLPAAIERFFVAAGEPG